MGSDVVEVRDNNGKIMPILVIKGNEILFSRVTL
jgi:hypothetical protein